MAPRCRGRRLGRRLNLRWRGTPLDPRTTGAGRPRGAATRHQRPVGRPEAVDEHRVSTEWRRHIAGWQALENVEVAAAREAAAARALDEAVRAALAAGATEADIGRVTGMTGRSATQRWSTRD